MVRAPCCEKMGLKKGPWSPDEDQILVDYIQQHGHGNWRALPKLAGLLRCGKSCRLRWTNYLRPDIKRGNFTKEEEDTIITLHEKLGNRWSAIAARLPGRTDNEIKNVWHTHLKKKLIKNHHHPKITDPKYDTVLVPNSDSDKIRVSSPQQDCSSSEMSSVTTDGGKKTAVKKEEEITDYSSEYFPQIDESFWIEDYADAVRCTDAMMEEGSMDFWYNLFIRAGDSPDLPGF